MNHSTDEARAARIQHYKEERRKQLTARTALLFSANVTDRKGKRANDRTCSEDSANTKATSELQLNAASPSVAIRTTRTSRLRAAAAAHPDNPTQHRKSRRSSSVNSLIDDKPKTLRQSKIVERDKKTIINKRHSREEKENFKNISSPRHSIHRNVKEKDQSKVLVTSPTKNDDTNVNNQILNLGDDKLNVNNDKESSKYNGSSDKIDDFSTKKVPSKTKENGIQDEIKLNLNGDISKEVLDVNPSINPKLNVDSHKDEVPKVELVEPVEPNVIEDVNSDIVEVKDEFLGGFLNVACVRKVERFSELLSNLCSPSEADFLFEDILADNGLENEAKLDPPSCGSPCKRVQPRSSLTSTPKSSQTASTSSVTENGTASKSHTRTTSNESQPNKTTQFLLKTPKNSFKSSLGVKSIKSTTNTKIPERRRSSEISTSHIPLFIKSPPSQTRHSPSPTKPDLARDTDQKVNNIKHKRQSSLVKNHNKVSEKSKSDSETSRSNDRKQRTQKETNGERYQTSRKRLTRLESSPINSNETTKSSPKSPISSSLLDESKIEVNKSVNTSKTETMSILHESVIPHASTSRLSQEMDSLAALTKQTLDRVNKLSNNLVNNKSNIDTSEPQFDALFASSSNENDNGYEHLSDYSSHNNRSFVNRGVTERLNDIDTAAKRLIDFEKQSAMFSDLSNECSSQKSRIESTSLACGLAPVSILKRKSLNEELESASPINHSITSPPVTFSPNVIEPRNCRSDKRQGILKKRRSLDESQVARRRSCSPEVSFADDGSLDDSKPTILKNRRSSLEDVIRNHSPDGQIQGILKRKMSKEDDHVTEDFSQGSPEPHGILKRKSNSSSSSSTASSHVSITQAVLLAAAGGAEIFDDDRDSVRPILKKKSFSEERPCLDFSHLSDTPRPILKKKSLDNDDQDDLPKKPILKTKRLSSEEGHASSFDLSEDDRSSRRPSLLRSRTSDHSGSECEATVKPILKQRGSSLTRERSQSPRPRLSFCADSDANISATSFNGEAGETPVAGPSRLITAADPGESATCAYPSAVLRRRNLRPKSSPRSKSIASDGNDELLSILNNRRLKVDKNCDGDHCDPWTRDNFEDNNNTLQKFPSVATRIQNMEQVLNTSSSTIQPKARTRGGDRYKTQPITVEEMRSITSSLEPSQAVFRAFGPIDSSFPSRPAEPGPSDSQRFAFQPQGYIFEDLPSDSIASPFFDIEFAAKRSSSAIGSDCNIPKDDSYGEATFLDYENIFVNPERRQSTLDEIEKEVDKVRVALDEDSRALEEDEKQHAEGDNWSLNVSYDSGVFNRASSRDSGPQSGEELGVIETQDIRDTTVTNQEWSPTTETAMHRQRNSTEVEENDESDDGSSGFALGLVKSNSVVARASMWQQLQQQAKGTPKPLLRHNRSKTKESVADRFKTQPINFTPPEPEKEPEVFGLAQSKSTANVLDRDEDAKLDEDDPAKLTMMEKMKMFNSRLIHKPPVAGLPKKDDRNRSTRLKTMPVLASQVQEAMDNNNERLTQSFTHSEIPRNPNFQMKMELFRSASAKNTSLSFLMKNNPKFKSLELDDDEVPPPVDRRPSMTSTEARGILKTSSNVLPRPHTLIKGESSEGLKDEGIDSSSDESASSSVSSSEKSCSSNTSDEIPGPKTRRFQPKKPNRLQSSRTDSDIVKVLQSHDARKIQLPCANELMARLNQAKNPEVKTPLLGKLKKTEDHAEDDKSPRYKRFVKKLDEPIQLGKLRRPPEKVEQKVEIKPPTILKISSLNQDAKNKFFGIEPKKEKNLDELAAKVRQYIPQAPCPVGKSMSTHFMEPANSGSDGESSGGREVRQINTRVRQRVGGGVQRSATHAEMPHRGGTIAERLAALQAAGANDWRARVCRLSPERDDTKAIERVKNKINENLNAAVDEKIKVQIEENELQSNILADRRNKLETAAQGWRKRVPQCDANLYTVAGKLERDKVPTATPPLTPPPTVPASPGIPVPNKFRSRKPATSPTNGFASGPLRSASCAVVNNAVVNQSHDKPERDSFKRSHSVTENISQVDENNESPGAEKTGSTVRIPRADDETFQAFFTPVLDKQDTLMVADFDVDLDAIDSRSRQLLANDWSRRAKRERKQAGSRNPLKALAARTDIREEYSPLPSTFKQQYIKEKVTANCGLAAEALAALATKEDFSNVSLRNTATTNQIVHGVKSLMLLHVKGRRRVQTRLVEPVHSSVNRGDCFVLVTPEQVFLYIGLYANVIERNRSTDIALHIHNTKDLGCKSSTSVLTIDEQNKNFNNRHWNEFWSLLGVKDGVENYKPTETGHPDEDEIYESCIVQTNMCYEVMDDELVPIKEYWGQLPKISMLHQSKTIVFDFGSEMYIWYGKNVPLESRRRAAQLAQELFDEGYNYEDCHVNPVNAAILQGARDDNSMAIVKTSKTRPEWAILSKVTQHMETILFKEKFLDWPDYSRVIRVKPQENKTNTLEITPCDVAEMIANDYQDPDLILEGSHVGRGTHYYDKESMRHFDIKTKSVCKWVIRESDFQKVEKESEIGDFFSADSYIIRWEYQITVTGRELNGKPSKHNTTGRDRCAYFCWQGKDASSNEKGTAALLTVELDKEKGPQVRVAQGNEPPAFLNLFQGNLVIHQGKRDTDKSRYKLFVTRGNVTNEAYLLHVPCSVRQLRSRGSLLLVDTEKGCLHIWHGSRSLKHTKNIAIELANKLIARKSEYLFGKNASNVKITEVKEGDEPKEVLEALGGTNKQYYNSVLSAGKDSGSDVTPRLFHFTDLGGQFEAHEVLSPLRHEHLVTPFPFEQRELYSASQPALFLLDDGKTVWLWQGWWPRGEDGELEPAERNTGVGAFAQRWQSLRAAALRSAVAYCSDPRLSRRSDTRPDVLVVAAGLEPDQFTHLFDTWREHDDAAEANIEHGYKAGEVLSGAIELSRLTSCDAIVPLAALQRRPLPDHVDPQHLERHLASPDFIEAFGITKEEFAGLPAWKQTSMKKDVGLF